MLGCGGRLLRDMRTGARTAQTPTLSLREAGEEVESRGSCGSWDEGDCDPRTAGAAGESLPEESLGRGGEAVGSAECVVVSSSKQ